MRYILVFFLLLSTLAFGQGKMNPFIGFSARYSATGLPVPPPDPPVFSTTKNIRPIAQVSNLYNAFGFVDTTAGDKVAGFWREGKNHLEWGRCFYRMYDKTTDTWGAKHYYDDSVGSALDHRDTWGGTYNRNGKDSVIIFTSLTDNHLRDCDWGSYIYYVKGAYNSVTNSFDFSPKRTKIISLDTAILGRNRGVVFGHIAKRDDTPGHYCIMLFDWNQNAGTYFRTSAILTNDYFDNFWRVTVFENFVYSEGTAAYMGNKRLVAALREGSNGSNVAFVISSDGGLTWTFRGATNLGTQGGIGITIPYLYPHSDTLVDVWYEDRGSLNIQYSLNNTWAQFLAIDKYGKVALNEQKIWAQNDGKSGSNPSLGYPSVCKLSDTTTLVLFSKERGVFANTGVDSIILNGRVTNPYCGGAAPNNPSEADLMWSINDGKGATALPAAFDSCKFFLDYASNGAVISVYGLTEAQWQHVDGIECDLSTASDFSTFDSASVRINMTPKELIHNWRFFGLAYSQLIYFQNLKPATTYYVRFRTYNSFGKSAWVSTSWTRP